MTRELETAVLFFTAVDSVENPSSLQFRAQIVVVDHSLMMASRSGTGCS
jgi:hypothetical protein